MALVEQQVEHREHLRQPTGQLLRARHAVGDARARDLALGTHDALCHRVLGGDEGPGDLGGRESEHGTQCERHLPLAAQRRVAAGEDQLQAVVGLGSRLGAVAHQYGELGSVAGVAAEPVQRPAPGHGQQPGGGRAGDPLPGPVLEGLDDRLLETLLRQVEVAQAAHQRGCQVAGLRAEGRGHGRVRLRGRGRGPGRLRARPGLADLCHGRSSWVGRSCGTTGLISTAWVRPGQVFASSSASSRSATSISQ